MEDIFALPSPAEAITGCLFQLNSSQGKDSSFKPFQFKDGFFHPQQALTLRTLRSLKEQIS